MNDFTSGMTGKTKSHYGDSWTKLCVLDLLGFFFFFFLTLDVNVKCWQEAVRNRIEQSMNIRGPIHGLFKKEILILSWFGGRFVWHHLLLWGPVDRFLLRRCKRNRCGNRSNVLNWLSPSNTFCLTFFSPHWPQTASLAVCIQRPERHPSHVWINLSSARCCKGSTEVLSCLEPKHDLHSDQSLSCEINCCN